VLLLTWRSAIVGEEMMHNDLDLRRRVLTMNYLRYVEADLS